MDSFDSSPDKLIQNTMKKFFPKKYYDHLYSLNVKSKEDSKVLYTIQPTKLRGVDAISIISDTAGIIEFQLHLTQEIVQNGKKCIA